MLKIVAKNFVKKDKVDEFKELCKELVASTLKEEGNISYELFQDIEDPTILTFIEEWENAEVLAIHAKSEHFTRIVPMLGKLTEKEMQISKYTKAI
ncbi:putative quinol monooxygenase [Clostridium sp. DL1XJH146]